LFGLSQIGKFEFSNRTQIRNIMAITSNRVSLNDLISRNEENYVVLPNFQRKFVWKETYQKALVASILADLPIGSLLILKGGNKDFAARALCFDQEVTPKDECEYVLDGQQRLSTLKTAFFDVFNSGSTWKSAFDNLFYPLRVRWFIDLEPEQNSDDCFGFERLNIKLLSSFEQDDLVPYLVTERIKKTSPDFWFHPGFSPKDANGQVMGAREKVNEIARLAAKKKWVPLHELRLKEKGIHRFVLQRIAREQAERLAAQCADGKRNIKDILGLDIDPANHEEVQVAWISLATNWAVSTAVELEKIVSREIPTIALDKSEIKRAVCIFEAVNRGGTALAVYDLIVARSAREEKESLTVRIKRQLLSHIPISLLYDETKIKVVRDEGWTTDWIMAMDAESDVPSKQMQPQIVNMLSLVAFCKKNDPSEDFVLESPSLSHIKKERHLSLTSTQINKSVDKAMTALARAFAFLQFRCGVRTVNDLAYSLMILPIAFVLHDDKHWTSDKSLKKIERWYWTSLFGGRYRERQNETCVDDINALAKWCDDLDQFDLSAADARILNYEGYSDRSILLREDPEQNVPTAISDGILQFILSCEPFDFADATPVRLSAWLLSAKQVSAEIHHIIPLKNAAKLSESTNTLRRQSAHILNSPLNLTWITRESNRNLGAQPPSTYLAWLPTKLFPEHCLPSAVDFQQNTQSNESVFYKQLLERRYEALLNAIRKRLNDLSK
jgi:hypothetical protein